VILVSGGPFPLTQMIGIPAADLRVRGDITHSPAQHSASRLPKCRSLCRPISSLFYSLHAGHNIISPHRNAWHKMRLPVTHVAWSDCLSQGRSRLLKSGPAMAGPPTTALCLLTSNMNPTKKAEPIDMPFGALTRGVQGTMCWPRYAHGKRHFREKYLGISSRLAGRRYS